MNSIIKTSHQSVRVACIGMVLALLFLFAVMSPVLAYGVAVTGDSSKTTNVYLENSKNSPVLTKINRGDLFLVLSKDGEMWKVFTLDNNIGYVNKNSIIIRWNDGVGIGLINDPSGSTTIFYGASSNAKVARKIGEGELFIVIGRGSWFRILTREKTEGFVHAATVVEIYP
ncbi:MAG: hypothetical protein AB2L14_17870 [Candidatus Xenobiia bacterium LiM19]